jgi:hypothetical protein
MFILFSPSEGKAVGGTTEKSVKNSFLFPELFDQRLAVVRAYSDYVMNAKNEDLIKLFGTKNQKVIDYYREDILKRPSMKVIERYQGVAYEYLDYKTLSKGQKNWVEKTTIIFSNLFGPMLAGDRGLPDYKLKQGEKIGALAPENVYKKSFTTALDDLLSDEPYLDLRAGFYNKFYKPISSYTTLKFIKNGKVLSHLSKACRGIVLRQAAIRNIQTMDEFMNIKIENFQVEDVIEDGIHREIVYQITK